MKPTLVLVVAASLVATAAHAEKLTIDEDTFFTIGVLAQPQFTVTEDGAPDEGTSTDFYVRRARLVLTGQFDPHVGFIFITDQPNWGKNGDYSAAFIVQDAIASYKFGPELTLSAGFMLLPFTRNDYQSAGALNAVDFRSAVIKFPTGRAFRDMGVEARGLVAGERIYYRAGVFNGNAGRAGTMTTAEVNSDDFPRLTGNLRYNILGKEEGYAFQGIYFAKEPIINVGVGADWQQGALSGNERYLAMAVDAFVDYPLNEDMEIVGQAAVIRYDGYAAGAAVDQGTAFYVEGGFRFMQVEPLAVVEFFDGDAPGTRVITTRLGVNYWVTKHNYNIKAELAIPHSEDADGRGSRRGDMVGTVQAQVVF